MQEVTCGARQAASEILMAEWEDCVLSLGPGLVYTLSHSSPSAVAQTLSLSPGFSMLLSRSVIPGAWSYNMEDREGVWRSEVESLGQN